MAPAFSKKELRKVVGDPKKIANTLAAFRKTARVLSSNQKRMIAKYAKQWVVLYQGRVCAQGSSFESAMSQVEKLGLPRDSVIVRFIEKSDRTLIL